MKQNSYLGGLIHAIGSLLTGMKTSMTVFLRQKTTEQYPENRATLKLSPRFRGTLIMPHNDNNEHRCVACGLCQMACPNDTIRVTSHTVETEDGKKKKVLEKYEYDLGSCMFCQLCVNACPHDAITFDQNFEHAVFDRTRLVLTLNHPGSHTEEKKKSATPQSEAAKQAVICTNNNL
ncbi:NADH-quinone oxidoreductase subunit I [Bacteroides helcogenes]|uniref:NADH-quinone oxidoreductase subunit I n=1 Tax=Bacteroides helcogenes (strain ATCC 35417 / DSM 20613 / JCM 6297 / CCUG 15421 / P 36-108) TaxID=693979 RepID=E6SU03_BACT6|nr:NADH-quinone oxidoreductase subunit I [Bacteroides helcogenes]ADV43304.1 NADH dehydrogenase I, chain I [Bacteroides helcogenes P 36-108]MDY5238641.1 NADH-quinone oxidoreductase subunit I [Bacteroides helcogenes]